MITFDPLESLLKAFGVADAGPKRTARPSRRRGLKKPRNPRYLVRDAAHRRNRPPITAARVAAWRDFAAKRQIAAEREAVTEQLRKERRPAVADRLRRRLESLA